MYYPSHGPFSFMSRFINEGSELMTISVRNLTACAVSKMVSALQFIELVYSLQGYKSLLHTIISKIQTCLIDEIALYPVSHYLGCVFKISQTFFLILFLREEKV